MRNLKKVLALALATVMLLGMMSMASAAAFKDEAAIAAEYDVAVDVMQAIGVFEGSDGYLNPKNTLTRAEAAKVITYIALTKANANKLGTADAPFADVAADHWAAASIAYAKNMGIVGGMTETEYAPNGTLTGYQFAKMLLVVLGYKADAQGYTGAAWSSNVNYDALTAGLLKGLAIDLAANITREQAAQMAFNALKANTVYYTNTSNVTIGGVAITMGGNLVETTTKLYTKLGYALAQGAAYDNAFGYSCKDWTYNAKVVATEKNYTVLASYAGTAGALTENDLYAVVGTDDLAMHVYVNGVDTTVVTADKGDTTAAGLAAYAGALVEVVNNNNVKEVIVTVPTLTKVTKVIDATATADRKVELNNAAYTITTNNYEKDQYVLAYVVGGEVKKHEAAATVYGTMTQTAKTGARVTTLYVDGTAVPVAGTAVDTDADEFAGALNKKYTVVLSNGYAIDVVGDAVKASMSNIVYVYGGGEKAGEYTGSAKTYEVKVIYMDGTMGTIKVDQDYTVGSLMNNIAKVVDADTTDGIKELEAVVGTVANPTATPAVAYGVQTVADLNKAANATSATGTDVKAYFTANTKVLTITVSPAGVYSAAVTELPAGAADYDAAWMVYSKTAAGAYEAEVIVTEGAPAVTTTDLYYVVGTEVGKVYVAAADKTYGQYNVYNVATGEKIKVAASAALTTGFKSLTKVDENGVYTFGAAVMATPVTLTAQDLTAYGTLVSGGDLDDADASAAVIVNTTATTGMTLTKMVTGNATVTGYALKAATGNKVVAFVITGFTAAT